MSSSSPRADMGILFDISRLISNIDQSTPTGIDRVDLRYADWASQTREFSVAFVRQVGDRLEFVQKTAARLLIDYLDYKWNGRGDLIQQRPQFPAPAADAPKKGLSDLLVRFLRSVGRCCYLNASHFGIDRPGLYLELATRWRTRFAFYIHDLLPIEFPEYVKARDPETHNQRLKNILSLGSLIITNSNATRTRIADWSAREGYGSVPSTVLYIGLDKQFEQEVQVNAKLLSGKPYFMMVGTIEPRKNHLSMLSIWRKMSAQESTSDVPLLNVIGKRGWESSAIVSFLERCPSIKPFVREMGNRSDDELRNLLLGSRALLFPSFGEGWGMPLVEALAMRVPCICSSIEVFREAGQDIPDYIDPLDLPAWEAAIREYSADDSPRRNAQLTRLPQFKPPSWDSHFVGLADALKAHLSKPSEIASARRGESQIILASRYQFKPEPSRGFLDLFSRRDVSNLLKQADQHRDDANHYQAATHYFLALQQDARNGAVWVQYGHMLKELGDFQAAYEAYSTAFYYIPTDVDLHIQMGHLLKLAARPEDANQYYRLAFELDPKCDALAHLA